MAGGRTRTDDDERRARGSDKLWAKLVYMGVYARVWWVDEMEVVMPRVLMKTEEQNGGV